MARNKIEIVQALRATALHLENSNEYQWGHMGSCNCGFLGQQITHLDKAEIHRRAMQRYGDWNEQLNDYCPTSGLPFDDLVSELLTFGFDVSDLKHLEKLSDPYVLGAIAPAKHLRHNHREDVVLYLRTWADKMESDILEQIELPQRLFRATVSAGAQPA